MVNCEKVVVRVVGVSHNMDIPTQLLSVSDVSFRKRLSHYPNERLSIFESQLKMRGCCLGLLMTLPRSQPCGRFFKNRR